MCLFGSTQIIQQVKMSNLVNLKCVQIASRTTTFVTFVGTLVDTNDTSTTQQVFNIYRWRFIL
ncbi:hypothetical protein HanRHA438_Chr04g0171851 [Helianthus annuus]|uniref:Uncharacterized protein n=1 Tax=Helianthus annuus TaxID=4232 RepID=A0A9K3J7E7_HELAN|nr:hypothetical protein HanXRQr2_Chr04g0161691 [Helianthus annuus]KAJ0926495.1 hypothetical protein HanRHA438_Chr04g0171851 [Helianthus annuus]KAJ0930967.1 hypothetical protein HanPSC8_Chr04g0155791 [Helianthus annuus]